MTGVQDLWMATATAENSSARRREQLRRLLWMQRAAEHLATAQFLERQADHAATPLLGSLLRERAAQRRWWGEQLRSGRGRDHGSGSGAGALRGGER
jgi:hypothetical protein